MAFQSLKNFVIFLLLGLSLALTQSEAGGGDPMGDIIKRYIDHNPGPVLKPAVDKKGKTGQISAQDRQKFEEMFGKIVSRSLYERKLAVSLDVLKDHEKVHIGHNTYHVFATSFGKPGNKGESNFFKDGTKVGTGIVAGALPDNSVVGKSIMVRRVTYNGGRSPWVKVLLRDLGPWFMDDPYWLTKTAPRAVEYFKKKKAREWDNMTVLNPAGLDLTPWAWQKLGVPAEASTNFSGYVEWKFAQ